MRRRAWSQAARAACGPALVALGLAALTAWNLTRSDALPAAERAYARRDFTQCVRFAREHLAHRPWNRRAALLTACALSQLDYPDEAEPYYRRAGRLALDELQIRAYALARANEHRQAAAAYRAILARWPDNIIALRRLAAVQLALQDRDETLKLANRMIRVPRAEAIGYTLRGVVHHNAEDRADAVAAYERVLQLDPELKVMPLPHRVFWENLGSDLVALGRIDDARRYLRRAVAESPDARLYTMLGRADRLAGDADDAERCFRRAAELDRQYAFPHVHLGQLAIQRQDLEAAVAELTQALRLDRRNYEAAYTLGMALRRLGRDAEARRYEQLADELRARAAAIAARRGPLPDYAL